MDLTANIMMNERVIADPQTGNLRLASKGRMSHGATPLWFLQTTAARYAASVVTTSVFLAAVWGIGRIHSHPRPFILIFPALVFCALYCGIGPSIAATALSIGMVRYWFQSDLVGSFAFLFAAVATVAMAEAHRRSRARLQNAQKELDERVKERTAELDSANNSLRGLTARLMQLQDDERRRFARELHDSVGQTLAALNMNLSLARSEIDRLTKTSNTLADSEALVQEMSKEIRTISHLLHPPLLDEAGLVSALRWYVEGFAQRSNIKVDLDIDETFGRLPRELETAVFRIVQECLTNVHRHSGSVIAQIRIARSQDAVHVAVADSGKGIPEEKQDELATAGTPGVGITGMRERIRQLGGSLEIHSDDKGTRVAVLLPVEAASIAAA